MDKKSRNNILFIIFIFVILLIIAILVVSVYNTRNKNLEQYKVSLNNVLYDENYNFVSLDEDAVLKKEWNNNFYLYKDNGKTKYSLGTETVLYDKSIRQVVIYGIAYQVFLDGSVDETNGQVVISNLDDFQFFKLNDRKYLIIANNIKGADISTIDYLIVSIDRAGNATLLNHSINIKTINPLKLNMGDIIFDVANEKLINGENEIDLKKINGSTNEYVQSENKDTTSDDTNDITGGSSGSPGGGYSGGFTGSGTATNSSNSSGTGSISNTIYKEIVNQIINLSGAVSTNTNKTSLYKNISLRDISAGSNYIDVFYSIIDPENQYLQIYLSIQPLNADSSSSVISSVNCDSDGVKCIQLSKEETSYRVTGLTSNKEYVVSLNYLKSGASTTTVADSVTIVTSETPVSVRIIEQDFSRKLFTYNIKLYSTIEGNVYVAFTNCETGSVIRSTLIDKEKALTATGTTGVLELDKERSCVILTLVDDSKNKIVDSYHKIKTGY